MLDSLHDAVRPDLADVRLADRVFAPHYAAPLTRRLIADAQLRAAPDRDSEVLANMPSGTMFELLDVTGGRAWGVAPAERLVGYLDADVLAS